MPSNRWAASITASRVGSAMTGCSAASQNIAEIPAHAEKLRFMSCSCARRGVDDQASLTTCRIDFEIGIVREPDKINLVPGIKHGFAVRHQHRTAVERQHE